MTPRQRSWARWLWPVVLVFSLEAAAQTPATNAAEAKKHFLRSKELYDDGDFTGALKELERSYAMVPNYKLLFNMGQIHAQTQDYAAALKSFRKFLVDGGDEVPEARRADVLKEVDRLRTRVAELTIIVNQPGAEVTVDDVAMGQSPLSAPITVNVGKRRVTATLANHFPVTKLVDVAGLDTVNVRIDLTPLVTTPAVTTAQPMTPAAPMAAVVTEPPAKPFRLPVWIPWAAAAAIGVGAGVVSGLAWQSSQTQKQLLDTYGTSRTALDATAQRTRTLALTADILWGGTAAAGIGALLYTLLRPSDSPEPQGTLTLIPSFDSLTLVTTW